MKKEIHPAYYDCTVALYVKYFSDKVNKKELRIEICSTAILFMQAAKLVDSGGRVDRFQKA